jgi:hypothetical protein
MTATAGLNDLRAEVAATGLAWRGAFHPRPADDAPPFADGSAVGTLALLGFVGGEQWPAFAASPERADGRPDPLDRWSRRLIDGLAARHGARPLYPSDGPPWLPFQRWALRAEPVHVSPLGILIHPDFGLWHAYRGALAFGARLALPALRPRPSPCDACAARPCLATCPVDAVRPSGYDHVACKAHVASAAGADCFGLGCQARRSCPVGAEYRYGADQAGFHMRAFVGRR